MKKYLLLIASVLLFAACSTPKYAYYFDHYDYNSGKKKVETPTTQLSQVTIPSPEMSPLQLDEQAVTANAEARIKPVENTKAVMDQTLLAKEYSSLSKSEKKEFRKELKTVVKKMVKAKKSGESIESIEELKAMDHDLKMALIFTVVAIVLGAFYSTSSVFGILSLISLIVAIVFFIQWIARQ